MKSYFKLFFLFIILTEGIFIKGYSQTDSMNIRNSALKVFIDCNTCDIEFIKRKIDFVNYVRDTKEAQVHILFTRQVAGNGGREYSFVFIGEKEFTGKNDTLKFISQADNTSDEIRDRQVQYLKIGLMPYVSHTKLVDKLNIKYDNSDDKKEIVKDKWNSWVFRLSSNTWMNGESSYSSFNLWSNIEVKKITPDWKQIYRLGNSFRQSVFKIEDSPDFVTLNRSYDGSALIVKSLNGQWSAGLKINTGISTYNNYDLDMRLMPAIEYNFFPYKESSVKQFTIRFESGYEYSNYTDTTIFDKLTENLLLSQLSIAYKINKKWGSINTSISGSDYWHDLTKYDINLYSSLSIRIIKGLSVRLSGGGSFLRNQLSLRKEGASYEDILLRQQQVATDYSYFMSAGLSYTFGSIYNNIVNPRFDSTRMYFSN
ncbi:MAG: hypothetical protein GXO80_09105 [Chlorobi bacterium]|nr:hypothetical protein [Chlorobiota bacterium]